MRIERLDLHGYTVADAMSRFVRTYHWCLGEMERSGGELRGIEVIHGKGRGEAGAPIREELRAYLAQQGTRIKGFDAQLAHRGAEYLFDVPGRLAYMHGEDATGNGGCTIVVPRQRVSPPREWGPYR